MKLFYSFIFFTSLSLLYSCSTFDLLSPHLKDANTAFLGEELNAPHAFDPTTQSQHASFDSTRKSTPNNSSQSGGSNNKKTCTLAPVRHDFQAPTIPPFAEADSPLNLTERLNDDERLKLIEFIATKEYGNKPSDVLAWNKGEAFASLGLGHYIWYPDGVADKQKKFDENFPELPAIISEAIKVNESNGEVTIKGAPWDNKKNKIDKNSEKEKELMKFLVNPKVQQLQLNFQLNLVESELQQMIDPSKEAIEKFTAATREAMAHRAENHLVDGQQEFHKNKTGWLNSTNEYGCLLADNK